jgi:polar amino acid transport system permease protein
MSFDFDFALSILPELTKASLLALVIAIASGSLACLLGFLLEIGRRRGQFSDFVITLGIDAIRVTPLIVQLYFAFFVLPYWGITLPPMVVGIGCLALHYSSYLAEVFKAGIDAIPAGQFDAGNALGLRRWQIQLLIVLPLLLRNSIPAIGNYFLSILKATPYLSLIAVNELLGTAFTFASDTFRYYEPFAILGFFFLSYSLIIAAVVRRLEVLFLISLGDQTRAPRRPARRPMSDGT